MSHHHVHKARRPSKNARTDLFEQRLDVRAEDSALQVHAELIQHVVHSRVRLAHHLCAQVSVSA